MIAQITIHGGKDVIGTGVALFNRDGVTDHLL